jgi:C1A family cysteine protease
MSKIKLYFLFIFLCLTGANVSLSAMEDDLPDAPFPTRLTLRPSPPDAIQRLGAQELRVDSDGAESFPTRVDLRRYLPPFVYDQGNLGSCTANALGRALDGRSKITGAPVINPSRLFIYYGERVLEHSIPIDQGASLYSGLQTLKTVGFCSESTWPYDDGAHQFTVKPSAVAYQEALHHKVLDELGIAWIGGEVIRIRAALANNIFVPFGMTLFNSFNKARSTGRVPTPHPGFTDRPGGGHAMVFVGYDDIFINIDGSRGAFIFQNSWSDKWGDRGFGYLPYTMVSPYVTEAWGIQRITGAAEAEEMLKGISFHPSDYQIPQPTEQ